MSYKKSVYFFISDSRKALKFLQLDTTSISVFAYKFSKLKKYYITLLYSSVYFHFQYDLLNNNNSNMNETVKITQVS